VELVNLLRKHSRRLLFTTPSHSQKTFIFKKLANLYKLDISETDTHNPVDVLKKAEHNAAKIYGVKQTKFLTNGSSSGIITAVLACVNRGDKILLWNNAHPCHKNAAKLAGADIITYDVPEIADWGVPQAVTSDILKPYLLNYKIKAVIITSPTYEGYAANIKEIKDLCTKYNCYLIADEAHGALYPFSNRLPESAVNIADFTVQSLHKTAGGLNPTALIHTNTDLDINKALNLINTTSPSYPLLASVEYNISYLNSARGKKKLNLLIDELENLKKQCPDIRFGGDDITKLLIKYDKLSGEELSQILYEKYNIEDEKTNPVSTLLLCGIGTSSKKIKALHTALNSIVKKY